MGNTTMARLEHGLPVFPNATTRDSYLPNPAIDQRCFQKDINAALRFDGTSWLFDPQGLMAGPDASGLRSVLVGHDDPTEKNGFKLVHRSAHGDEQPVLNVGSHGGLHPVLGEYDVDIGDLAGFTRKVNVRVSAGLTDAGVVYGPASVTSVQSPNTTTFSDTGFNGTLNFYAQSIHQTYVVKFLTGANAGKSRYILSNNGATQIVCGAAFSSAIAIGDTYEIHKFTIPKPANNPQVQIWHGTDDSGNPLAYLCLDFVESLLDQGIRFRFEPTGSTFRDFFSIVPTGVTGQFDLIVGSALSSIYRNIAFGTVDGANLLRLVGGAFCVEINGGVRKQIRDTAVNLSLTNSDWYLTVDATGALRTITLPQINTTPIGTNRSYVVKNRKGANNVNVTTTGGDTINGAAPPLVLAPGAKAELIALSATNWETF